MVISWKCGKFKIDRVDFWVDEGDITEVTSSPIGGIKFYRDKKFSLNVVKDFAKNSKEMKDLVKTRVYYELDSI